MGDESNNAIQDVVDEIKDVLNELNEEVEQQDISDDEKGVMQLISTITGLPTRSDAAVLTGAAAALVEQLDDRIKPDSVPSRTAIVLIRVLEGVLRDLQTALEREGEADGRIISRIETLADQLDEVAEGEPPVDPVDSVQSTVDTVQSTVDDVVGGEDDDLHPESGTSIEIED